MKITIRKKKLKNNNYSLYLDIYNLGSRKYEFLNLYLGKDKEGNKETKLLAEKIRNQRETELQNNFYGFTPDFKKRGSFIKFFESKLPENTSSTYHYSLMKLKKFSKGNLPFSAINEQFLEKFKEFLLSEVSQNSAKTYFQNLRTILATAKREKVIAVNPSEFVKNISSRDVKRDFLTETEIKKLAETKCLYDEIKKAFIFSCFCGLRYSDLKNLKWGNLKDQKIIIRQKKTDDMLVIPLSTTAIKILGLEKNNIKYLPDVLVFNLPHKAQYNLILKKWFKVAEVNKKGSSHLGRHTYATLNLTKGTDIFVVSKLLGHKSVRTTQIYAQIIDSKKKEAVDRLPDISINE